jgi:hypothetical protein
MGLRRWSLGLGCATAFSLVTGVAAAEYQVALDAPASVELIDPWADQGGSRTPLSSVTLVHEDTLDPWRAASWTRVRSGLDTARARPLAQRPSRVVPQVSSGLDVPGSSPTDDSRNWVHADIVDPWAGSSSRP